MRLVRLGEILALKHKVAADPRGLEASLRNQLQMLWKYPHELFNVLEAGANQDVKSAADAHSKKALEGQKFLKKMLAMIDYLQSKMDTVSLGEMREILHRLVKLVATNKDAKFDAAGNFDPESAASIVQFPHVSAIIEKIFENIRPKNKAVIRAQQESYGKARTGLARIASLAHSMLETLQKLEVMVPEKFTHVSKVDVDEELPGRFAPQHAPLGEDDIIEFIRHHGIQYGIPTHEDWRVAFEDDPQFKDEMTTVINALKRGQYPRGSADAQSKIAEILQRHKERKSKSNAPLFEDQDEG